jgi:Holliday junction DNA helicase RuvB
VCDFAQIKGNGSDGLPLCRHVDAHGLDEMDNKILTTIIDKFKGGPVGLTTLATAVSESSRLSRKYTSHFDSGRIYHEDASW